MNKKKMLALQGKLSFISMTKIQDPTRKYR